MLRKIFFLFTIIVFLSTTFSFYYIKSNPSLFKRNSLLCLTITDYTGINPYDHEFKKQYKIMENSFSYYVNGKVEDIEMNKLRWVSRFNIMLHSDYIIDNSYFIANRYNDTDPIKINNEIGGQLIHSISNGSIVYIDHKSINRQQFRVFLDLVVPNITKTFYLINVDFQKENIIKIICRNKYILKFYTRAEHLRYNEQARHYYERNIDAIPIGIDYETPFKSPIATYLGKGFMGTFNEYLTGLNKLHDSLLNMYVKQSTQQIKKVFVDYFGNVVSKECYLEYINATNNDRDFWTHEMLYKYSKTNKCWQRSYAIYSIKNMNKYEDIFYLNDKQMNQFDLFKLRSEYNFLLTIPGDGLDCYRIWEGLIFNNIIISKRTKYLDKFLQKHKTKLKLPIVFVKKYSHITKAKVKQWYKQYKNFTSFNNEKTRYYLTNAYWMDYIKEKHDKYLM
eukprot:119336_1